MKDPGLRLGYLTFMLADTHAKKAPHLAGKAAEHRDALAAQRDRLRDDVAVCGLVVELIKELKAESDRELEAFFQEAYQKYEQDHWDQTEQMGRLRTEFDRIIAMLEDDAIL